MSLESRIPKRVRLEAVGFACLLALMALDEYLDLPKWLFGEVPTPLRHHEFIMESTAVCLVAAIVMAVTWLADVRLRRLKTLLVMCSWCRRVQLGERWISIDTFLQERDATRAEYGLCPACYAASRQTSSH